jgi:hypothetical protein
MSKPWTDNMQFSQFIDEIFPKSDHPSLNDLEASTTAGLRASLMARKLKKHASLTFQPTDDLRNHLRLNQKAGVVEIFHHTAFLKEHLRLTRDSPRNITVGESISMGALPRQLVLEALDSIQKILFPLTDKKSHALLQSLTSSRAAGFDPDCLRFESSSIRLPEEKDIAYYYFGSRLMDLYEELQDPKPRGWLERWLERRSAPRYVMMATVFGVLAAVLLGIASLIVSSYQTWITYRQWKGTT